VDGLVTFNLVQSNFPRLLVATNPESGSTCFGIWSSGYGSTLYQRLRCGRQRNAAHQARAQSDGTATVTTTYQYDALNRLTSKTYSDGTTLGAYYYYDQASAWGTALNNPRKHIDRDCL
jgi:YD repeat-containing protein